MGDEASTVGQGAFDALVGLLNYPMFVVTTTTSVAESVADADGGGVGRNRPSGCLVGFSTQTSIDPPRFLLGLSKNNHTYRVADTATHLAVHVLRRSDRELGELFGGQTGDRVDKFTHCRWHAGPHKLPILDDAPAWFAGEIVHRFDAGDHVAFLVAPTDGATPPALGEVLSFADVRDIDPGHDA